MPPLGLRRLGCRSKLSRERPTNENNMERFARATRWRLIYTGRIAMLWTIAVILLILWALGFAFHIGAGLIHILLVIALVVGLIQLFTGRRAV